MFNRIGLKKELEAAGIYAGDFNAAGIVRDQDGTEIQTLPNVAAVLGAHDATAWDEREQRASNRQAAAEPFARTIPNGWRTWTQAEWTAYYNANISAAEIDKITNLAQAKTMLTKMNIVIDRMAKMEIALRDHSFPDLPEG